MKSLIVTIFTLLPVSCFSSENLELEFYRCVDTAAGKAHITNLPESSLNKDCSRKVDYFSIRLRQDYRNLENEYKKYAPETPDNNGQTVTDLDGFKSS